MSAQETADRIRAQRAAAGTLGVAQPHATQVVKGRTTTDVTVHGRPELDHDTVLEVALNAADETRDTLFGWRVGPLLADGTRRVTLHTD